MFEVAVTAHAYAKSVALDLQQADAVFSDNWFDLDAGETRRVTLPKTALPPETTGRVAGGRADAVLCVRYRPLTLKRRSPKNGGAPQPVEKGCAPSSIGGRCFLFSLQPLVAVPGSQTPSAGKSGGMRGQNAADSRKTANSSLRNRKKRVY